MKRGDMRISLLIYSLVIILAIVTFSGCSSGPKSFKETTLDDMYPILTDEQYQTLKSLSSDEEITKSLDKYWQDIDSTSGTRENECKAEYLRRLEYANDHFPDRRGWGRSDRKRIYLVYGPPCSIERFECTNIQIGTFSTIKSIEIWSYMTPGRNNSLPSYGDDINKGEKKFFFADMTGSGIYTILYSSEDCGDIDIRVYKSQ
jgi:GWxTD domain-containing protein